VLGILIYLTGRHFSVKKQIKSSVFFASFFALSLLFSIFLVIVAPPPPPSSPIIRVLEVEVISVNGREGFILPLDANDFGKIEVPPFNVTIRVVDGFNNKPVSGAVVEISGAEGWACAETGKDGIATLHIIHAVLEENIQQEYMSIEVTARGYFRYVNEEAIKLVRV